MELSQQTELIEQKSSAGKAIIAKAYNSGFAHAHDTYNSISVASDGKIYYVLSSDVINAAGKVFCYDPLRDEIELLGDLTDICGEKGLGAIAQGKSHVRFYESGRKLYFATHVGFYELIDGMDRLPVNPPDGYNLYPGGHILTFDLKTQQFEDLAIIPDGEGVVSMTMDAARSYIYGITWPKGNFFHYDINAGKLKMHGQISGEGEAGTPGTDFRSLCRSLLVDAGTGIVYFSTSEGNIYQYHPENDKPSLFKGADLKLDYFGKYDFTRPGSMAYNWRKIFWYAKDKAGYGVHGNSGYLFRFSPGQEKVEIVERITAMPSKKSGMFDQFSYGYLGFQLGPDQETIYYLTGAPIYIDGKRLAGSGEIAKGAAKGLENLHLVTFHIPSGHYQDHGPVFYENGERPLYVNAIAVGNDGYIYTLARVTEHGHTRTDLVRFKNPLGQASSNR